MKLCSYLNRKKAPRDQLKTFTSVEPFSYQGMYLLTKCWQNFPIQVAHRWVLSNLCGSQLRSHWKCPHLKTTPLDCETAALPARHPTHNQSPHHTHWETQGDYNTCVAAKIRTFSLKYCLNKETGGFIFQTDTISLAKWAKTFDCLITLAQLFLFLISLSLLCPLKRDGGPCQMDLYVLHTHKRVALQTINHTCGHIGLSEKRLQGLAV